MYLADSHSHQDCALAPCFRYFAQQQCEHLEGIAVQITFRKHHARHLRLIGGEAEKYRGMTLPHSFSQDRTLAFYQTCCTKAMRTHANTSQHQRMLASCQTYCITVMRTLANTCQLQRTLASCQTYCTTAMRMLAVKVVLVL